MILSQGSSPRMRGSLLLSHSNDRLFRIIPAHAGLTGLRSYGLLDLRDHPRACGAHVGRCRCIITHVGSSPRMRGSHDLLMHCGVEHGIIPAHAGLTFSGCAHGTPGRDHPRACGAHTTGPEVKAWRMGSSPRMRGSLILPWALLMRLGIIPAHAGLTTCDLVTAIYPGDHPRACGAHDCLPWLSVPSPGSSPRMRGSHFIRQRSDFPVGIIPAHAGLTSRRSRKIGFARDHPRACGAHGGMRYRDICV